MADPDPSQEREQGASSYSTGETSDKIPSKVGVYDRPENAGRGGGLNTMSLIVGLILLLIIGFVVWRVVAG